jgi:hypothetical protein
MVYSDGMSVIESVSTTITHIRIASLYASISATTESTNTNVIHILILPKKLNNEVTWTYAD